MEDVLEVYTRPFDPKRPQVCLDEASKQLIVEARPSITMKPGSSKCVDAEYRRCGTVSIFMVTVPLEGRRYVRVYSQRTAIDFAEVIRELCDEIYPDAEKIVLVLDNLNTHTTASLYKAFPACEARRLSEKLEIHYTPKHGSWLNMAEIELSILSRQCIDDYFETQSEITSSINAWEHSRNESQTGINWRFTTDDARIKLKKLYPTI